MIVDAIVDAIVTIISAAISLLPTSTLISDITDGVLAGVGNVAKRSTVWAQFTPLSEMLEILERWLQVVFPAIIGYRLFNWVYKHIPQISGFGPGSG